MKREEARGKTKGFGVIVYVVEIMSCDKGKGGIVHSSRLLIRVGQSPTLQSYNSGFLPLPTRG